jgi:hypothetical protein
MNEKERMITPASLSLLSFSEERKKEEKKTTE